MTDTVSRRRPRTRARTVGDSQPAATDNQKVTQTMKDLAKVAFENNGIKNKATVAEKKALAELTGLMAKAKVQAFPCGGEITTIDGTKKRVQMEVEMLSTTSSYIKIDELRKLVDEATFMKIVKATITDTAKFLGPALLEQCKGENTGKPSAKVKVAK